MTASTRYRYRYRNGRRPRAAAGFSLIELAVGIAIIGLLLGSLMVPLTTQVESRKVTETQKILDNAREALLGYAAANGYFPCPADYGFVNGGQPRTGANRNDPANYLEGTNDNTASANTYEQQPTTTSFNDFLLYQ